MAQGYKGPQRDRDPLHPQWRVRGATWGLCPQESLPQANCWQVWAPPALPQPWTSAWASCPWGLPAPLPAHSPHTLLQSPTTHTLVLLFPRLLACPFSNHIPAKLKHASSRKPDWTAPASPPSRTTHHISDTHDPFWCGYAPPVTMGHNCTNKNCCPGQCGSVD